GYLLGWAVKIIEGAAPVFNGFITSMEKLRLSIQGFLEWLSPWFEKKIDKDPTTGDPITSHRAQTFSSVAVAALGTAFFFALRRLWRRGFSIVSDVVNINGRPGVGGGGGGMYGGAAGAAAGAGATGGRLARLRQSLSGSLG